MNDNFFQDEEVQEVLFERGKSSENSVCVSGETIDGDVTQKSIVDGISGR